jgi:hypothetical protein
MLKPRFIFIALIALLLAASACSGPPETQVYIVLTATHQPPTQTALAGGGDAGTDPAPTAEASGGALPVDATPALPTPSVAQIQVAEQVFESGRMFWLQPTGEIWVMIESEEDPNRGDWLIFEDSFAEGDVEVDPELTPPAELYQPVRGFGLLWRGEENLRESLGWGETPEFGFVATYEYRPGGYLDSEGIYVPRPGIHVLSSMGNLLFGFDESEMAWYLIE